jgi:hypothetical protein
MPPLPPLPKEPLVPRVTPKADYPAVTIAPPSPAYDFDPALDAVDAAARRAAYARRLDAETGDPYRSQYDPTNGFVQSAHSFFRDLLVIAESDARAKGTLERALSEGGLGGHDPGSATPPPSAFAGDDVEAARERIAQAHERARKVEELRARRARSEKRDLTSAGTHDFMRPSNVPEWIADAYGQAGRQVGRIADALIREPLEPGMVQDNGSGQLVLAAIPRLSGGGAVAIQATQNSAIQETDATTASYAAPVGTVAGQLDLSRQLFDLSQPGLDRGIATDLGRASGVLLDSQIVSGSGASGQLRGLLNVSGILTATSAATGVQGQVSALWSGFRSLSGSGGFGSPDLADYLTLVSPGRFAWWSGGSGGAGVQVAPNLPGRTVLSGAVPEGEAYIIDRSAVVLVGGEPRVRVFEETGSGTLTVRVSSFAYAALAVLAPTGIFRLSGLPAMTF